MICFSGSDSNTDEWSNEYSQRLFSSLTGQIRELPSIDDNDDTDKRFQPPLDIYNQEQPLNEGYRLANLPNIIPSASISAPNEVLLIRHKRDVTLADGLSQTIIMDGSGITEEGSRFLFNIVFFAGSNISLS